MRDLKKRVKKFWEAEPCGARYGEAAERRTYFLQIEERRYALEPYIREFARFHEGQGSRILEIGVGAGSDHAQWLASGAWAVGTDLTEAAARMTAENARSRGLRARLFVGDAERLPLASASFDLVYSWGVLHHSPDTAAALAEVYRVLRPGGLARMMVYHVPSWSAGMLWVQHALLRGRPMRPVHEVLAQHLESPGTKAYRLTEFRKLLAGAGFTDLALSTHLSTSDLLLQDPSDRYQGRLYRAIWAVYPRWLVRRLGHGLGMVLMAEGRRPER